MRSTPLPGDEGWLYNGHPVKIVTAENYDGFLVVESLHNGGRRRGWYVKVGDLTPPPSLKKIDPPKRNNDVTFGFVMTIQGNSLSGTVWRCRTCGASVIEEGRSPSARLLHREWHTR